jgi:hypothetical protein
MVALPDVWKKLLQFNINSADNLVCFKDLEEIVIQSYVNFTNFLIFHFALLPKDEKCLSEDNQKTFMLAVQSFPALLNEFKNKN